MMFRNIDKIKIAIVPLILFLGISLILGIPVSGVHGLQGSQLVSEEDIETTGWLEVGRKSMPFNMPVASRIPLGISPTVLCPTMRLKSLLTLGDTLLIGTEGGLFGYSFNADSLFRMSGPAFTSINALALGEDDGLWVAGEKGVSIRRDGKWIHFLSGNYSFFERVTGLFPSDDKMWITTFGQGCGYMVSDTLTVLSRADSMLDDRVLCTLEEENRTVWFGTASGLCSADSFRWKNYRYGSKLPIGSVEDMIIDEEGNLFLAIARAGVARYNLGRVTAYEQSDGLPSMDIRAFSIDSDGLVKVAGKSGISTWDGSGWLPLKMPGVNFSSYDILSMVHDVEGRAMIGTAEGRLMIISRDVVREIDIPQVFPLSTVLDVVVDGQSVWFLSDSRILRSDRGFSEITLPDPWYRGSLTSMAIDRAGTVWVTSRFGILHHNGNGWEVFDRRLGLPTGHYTWVENGKDGELWFGTFDSGILRLTDKGWTHYTVSNGLPSGSMKSFSIDGNGVSWILSESGRIAMFDEDAWQEIDLPFRNNNDASGGIDPLDKTWPGIRLLRGSLLDDLAATGNIGFCSGVDAEGNVLLVRSDGIYRYSSAGWHLIELPPVRDVRPVSIASTQSGEIWTGTAEDGIFIRRSGSWHHIDASTGLSSDRITSIAVDPAGQVWCSTRGGGVTLCGYLY
jgi:ligand-binding sensor domain-containing protein